MHSLINNIEKKREEREEMDSQKKRNDFFGFKEEARPIPDGRLSYF
jgi:hypothetical protein